MKQHAPAAQRNREPILSVLSAVLPKTGLVLEIASGSGEHSVYFARALPELEWQPSDVDDAALASVRAYRQQAALPNLREPLVLDASAEKWPIAAADAVVCINMIHISPFAATEGLFAGAARIVASGSPLVTYGPYRFSGEFTAPSNAAFDASLRAQNPTWGVRDLDELRPAAARHDLVHEATHPLPANNHALVFRRL